MKDYDFCIFYNLWYDFLTKQARSTCQETEGASSQLPGKNQDPCLNTSHGWDRTWKWILLLLNLQCDHSTAWHHHCIPVRNPELHSPATVYPDVSPTETWDSMFPKPLSLGAICYAPIDKWIHCVNTLILADYYKPPRNSPIFPRLLNVCLSTIQGKVMGYLRRKI